MAAGDSHDKYQISGDTTLKVIVGLLKMSTCRTIGDNVRFGRDRQLSERLVLQYITDTKISFNNSPVWRT